MKRLPLFTLLVFLTSIVINSVGCSCRKSENAVTTDSLSSSDSLPSPKDTLVFVGSGLPNDTMFLAGFYKEYLSHISQTERKQFLMSKVGELDSTLYIQYKKPINGYTVKVAVKAYLTGTGVHGHADYYFINGNSVGHANEPYKFNGGDLYLATRRIIILDYKSPSLNYDKPIALGDLGHLPFFFLDVNFDGNKELLFTYRDCGQRGIDEFGIRKISGKKGITELLNTDYIPGFDKLADGLDWYTIDAWTEFDFQKKIFISSSSAGYSDNEKFYIKIRNGKAVHVKTEVYTCGFDTLVKTIYPNSPSVKKEQESSVNNISYYIRSDTLSTAPSRILFPYYRITKKHIPLHP